MQAVVFHRYGSPEVLQLKEVKKPVPKDNQILIKVHATTVTAGDCELRRFQIPTLFWLPMRIVMGIKKWKGVILGQEVAGTVVAVGQHVTRFKKGDHVFGATMMGFGGCAQYVCLPESYPIALKPTNMTLEEAATIPTGGINALHFITKSNLQRGERLLINGAGGSIGTYAVQLARSIGAKITCVDRAEKLDMLRSLGANRVIDYQKEDFTKGKKKYDVIIDIVGTTSFSDTLELLNKGGRYVLGNPTLTGMLKGAWQSRKGNIRGRHAGKKVIFELADYKQEHLTELVNRIEAGQLKSVIDKEFPLEQAAEAHRYVESGQKAGNVVIRVVG